MKIGDRATYKGIRGTLVAPAPFFRQRRWYFRALNEDGTWVREVVGESVLRDVETPTWGRGERVRVGVKLDPGRIVEVLPGPRYRVQLLSYRIEEVGPDLLDLDRP